MTNLKEVSISKVEMLIRKPVKEVFDAFIDPSITTKFWFTKSDGRLEKGKRVRWDWEMYGVSAELDVIELEQNNRILIKFDDDTTVEWIFTPRIEGTFVTVINAGFKGSPDEIINQVIDSTGGFTIVLCGLKALLEHNIILNLVSDRFPDAQV
ncbi:SRPBCC family protein [Cytobacillus firmus]|uniref:SRPBCC family protein n=1 Tax=Cytobacillus firmus TaxID=1399 RepID=A0AA46PRE7_CYTFI|nr:SRPBCC family protein [Cytobacillus firmus]KML44473.1 polyketide cyclase [Cytobacillus firmus]MCS0653331.1 SRPBCC family protein [Cytobacillus firmus]UYG95442.1 SRPBCC family protein [Cytobacillus firmus]